MFTVGKFSNTDTQSHMTVKTLRNVIRATPKIALFRG